MSEPWVIIWDGDGWMTGLERDAIAVFEDFDDRVAAGTVIRAEPRGADVYDLAAARLARGLGTLVPIEDVLDLDELERQAKVKD